VACHLQLHHPPNKLPELDDQVTVSMIVEAFIAKTRNTSMPPPTNLAKEYY
jgi:hypothetical protein